MSRNPISRQIAIVGIGCTQYGRDLGKSQGGLAVEACIAALRDAGLVASDVDGLCGNGNQVSPQYVQEGLGIPELGWWSTPPVPFSLLLTDAANAVFSGACDVAIAYQSQFRTIATSRSAGRANAIRAVPDPARTSDLHKIAQFYQPYGGRSSGYPGYMRRYMREYGIPREAFGLVAINSRSHASKNPHATLRDVMSMADYMSARMVRDPMCLLDMDYPVDGADAVVVTTAERAKDLRQPAILIEAMSYGEAEHPQAETYTDLGTTGQDIAAKKLWSKTDIRPADIDIAYLYDGYTVIALKWLESLGFCGLGEAGEFLQSNWDDNEQMVRLGGRVPVNSHGGSLSEGATQGAGHIREAVSQLRVQAGDRQALDARVALLAIGGLFNNSTAIVLAS